MRRNTLLDGEQFEAVVLSVAVFALAMLAGAAWVLWGRV
jgi:hypothetical protein